MKAGELVRTGWYCADCHRVFAHPVTRGQNGRGRFHSLLCGAPMIRVRVVAS